MVSENDVKQEISRKDFKNPILYQELLDNYILKEPAQSIPEIDFFFTFTSSDNLFYCPILISISM
ncbi:hypothetical protein ES705_12962 [subsurface metagenome]